MAFISVHYCLPNTIGQCLWTCGAHRPQFHDLMWSISCLKSSKSHRSTSKIVGLAALPKCRYAPGVFVILLSIFARTPAPILTHSARTPRALPHLSSLTPRALPLTPAHSRSLPLTPAHSRSLPLTPTPADERISTGERQRLPLILREKPS